MLNLSEFIEKNLSSFTKNKKAVAERLLWLEGRLRWVGEFNRSELVEAYSISSQQASTDIDLYNQLSRDNATYDHRSKKYVPSMHFQPIFAEDDILHWFRMFGENFHEFSDCLQKIDVAVIKKINQSIKKKMPINVSYFSFKKSMEISRVICPHHIIATPVRWHLRAWDYTTREFLDLPICRIKHIEDAGGKFEWISEALDDGWQTQVRIALEASDHLTHEQKKSVEQTYEMKDGEKRITERKCLVYYRLASMRLVNAVRGSYGYAVDPRFDIRVKNFTELLPIISNTKSPPVQPFSIEWLTTLKGHGPTLPNLPTTWIGTGLSKIAAAYGSDLTRHFHGQLAFFQTPLQFANDPVKNYACIVTLGAKHPDITQALSMASLHNGGTCVTANPSPDLPVKIDSFTGAFPEKDRRFVNCNSILCMSIYVEQYLNVLSCDFVEKINASTAISQKILDSLYKFNWRSKKIVIVSPGTLTSSEHIWKTVFAEAGITDVHYVDIKDYTHGEYLTALNMKNYGFIVISTPATHNLADIFFKRFIEKFEVTRIDIPKDNIQEQFWIELLTALHIAEGLSRGIGFKGQRPPSGPDSWRGWGDMNEPTKSNFMLR